jgi:hypothetical protein
MCAVGVGGADAVDVMAGLPWELKAPKVCVGTARVWWQRGRVRQACGSAFVPGERGVAGGVGAEDPCLCCDRGCQGVGGADAVDVMAGLPWELKAPKVCVIEQECVCGGGQKG